MNTPGSRHKSNIIILVCLTATLALTNGLAKEGAAGNVDVTNEQIEDILKSPHGLHRAPPRTKEFIAEITNSPGIYSAMVAENVKAQLARKHYPAVETGLSLLGEMGTSGVSNAVDIIALVREERIRGNLSLSDAKSLRNAETIGFACLKGRFNPKAVDLALQALMDYSDLEIAAQNDYILQTDQQKVVERIDAQLGIDGLPDQAKKAMEKIREKVNAKDNDENRSSMHTNKVISEPPTPKP